MSSDPRVTAKITRTADGDLRREYRVRGRSYTSADAVEQAVATRRHSNRDV